MLVRIIKAFPYGADGVHAVDLAAGEVHQIHDDIVPGLVAEGYVAVAEADADPDAAEPGQTAPAKPPRRKPKAG